MLKCTLKIGISLLFTDLQWYTYNCVIVSVEYLLFLIGFY